MIYDYIVVGSGFGGSVSALHLADKGYSVLVIEQGKKFNPSFTITAMAEYCISMIPPKDGSELTYISKQLILLEDEWRRKKYERHSMHSENSLQKAERLT
jgi:choline dehydrogenase-like flavoprotein